MLLRDLGTNIACVQNFLYVPMPMLEFLEGVCQVLVCKMKRINVFNDLIFIDLHVHVHVR